MSEPPAARGPGGDTPLPGPPKDRALSPDVLAKRRERDLRLRLAEVLARSGDVARARGHLADLVKKDGKDRAALRALAALEDQTERWDAASAVYRKLLVVEDGEALVDTALRLAEACERGGRLGDARGGLERALRVAPDSTAVRRRLAMVYNITGASRELAAMILEDAAAAADVAGRFTHLLHAGRLLLESDTKEDAARALSVIEEARSLRPEEAEVTLLLADAYAAMGRRPEAVALLRAAVASHKGRRSKPLGEIHRRISKLELGDGDLSEALESLTRAFECDPQNGNLAMELGQFALDLDDQEIAARAFRAVTLMKILPGGDGTNASAKALAYYHLGRFAEAQGDRRKARLMVEKAVSEDPQLEIARTLLDELRAG